MSEDNIPRNRQDDIVQKETLVEEAPAVVEETSQRPTIEGPAMAAKPKFVGLDCGTNLLVASELSDTGGVVFKMQRDAYFKISPKTEVNKNSIKISLDKRQANYFVDEDGTFIVVGTDALDIAIERNDVAERPLQKGVISPKSRKSLPILKRLIKELVGDANVEGSKIIFSIPAAPLDNNFDVVYHSEMIGMYLKELGFDASPINEAFALGLSELLDTGLTGVAVSCLAPGTKVYSDKGIVDIEDIAIGDEVITHKGRYRKVTNVVTKTFTGICTKVQLQGYANTTELYKFVDNHELYVNRGGKWLWVGCDDLVVGDIVGEPIVSHDFDKSPVSMTLCERTTCSKDYKKTSIRVSTNVFRLFGYFLGDGSVLSDSSGIQFDFGKSEVANIEDIKTIMKTIFKKKCNITDKGPNCTRVRVFSRGLASWFKNKFYDYNGVKVFPFDISRLTNSNCLGLLAGLIRSDGDICGGNIRFYNTSTNLVLLCKQLFSRLGVAAAISFREPRSHYFIDEDRYITGKLCEWQVTTGKKLVNKSLVSIISSMNCKNSHLCDRLFIDGGFCCSRVQKIEYEDYSGLVYDLQVDEDHSFSGPYLTIHNCGAGAANFSILHEGDVLLEACVTKSGDFIDNSAAQALDLSPSVVQQEKESGIDLLNPIGPVQDAIVVYYKMVIKYILENIAYELNVHKKELPLIKDGLPIVFGGGLTLPTNFIIVVKDILATLDFPIKISGVRLADEPLTAVSNGCLLAAHL